MSAYLRVNVEVPIGLKAFFLVLSIVQQKTILDDEESVMKAQTVTMIYSNKKFNNHLTANLHIINTFFPFKNRKALVENFPLLPPQIHK